MDQTSVRIDVRVLLLAGPDYRRAPITVSNCETGNHSHLERNHEWKGRSTRVEQPALVFYR